MNETPEDTVAQTPMNALPKKYEKKGKETFPVSLYICESTERLVMGDAGPTNRKALIVHLTNIKCSGARARG